MALNIKDAETEQLAAQVAALAGESKTHAVKTALMERRERLSAWKTGRERGRNLHRLLADEAWPQIPAAVLGQPLSKAEREAILGYGLEGH